MRKSISTALRMSMILGLAAFLGALGAALAAADAATVLEHGATVSERNALIVEVRVALSRAARVFVEYDNPQAGRYRTALSEPGAAHVIPLVRLRPETTYDYAIFVVNGAEEVGGGAAKKGGGRFTTGSLPLLLAAIPMRVHGRSSQALILSVYRRGYYVFYDEVGGMVWYYDAPGAVDIVQLPDGNFLLKRWEELVETTPFGEVVNRLELGGATGIPHHEITLLDDRRVIYPSRELVVIDDSANGGPAEVTFVVDNLRVYDLASGRVEQVWDAKEAWNLLDPALRGPIFGDGSIFRWTNLNSVSIGPRGNVVISLRARNQVVALSADLRSIEWQLHGPDSDYEFPDPNDRFYRQHTAAQLPNGNVLVFDNGLGRPDAEGGAYSRALELRLDEAAGTAAKVWEYRPTPDIYIRAEGSAYRLNNGHTLITFSRGDHEGSRSLVEVDAAGDEVFRVDTLYRHMPRGSFPTRYRAYGGIESIMGEAMLRPPAAAPAYADAATFDRDHYRAKEQARFQQVAALLDGRQRAAGGAFDLYLAEGRLVYAKEPCAPQDVLAHFFLHVFPAEAADLAAGSREQRFDNLDFDFWKHGVLHGGACLGAVTLPEYEIARLRTGQFNRTSGQQLWSMEFPVGPTAQRYRQARAAILSGAYGAPAARGVFDLYRDGRVLAYHKEPCAEEDLRERFFLHVLPVDSGNLAPQDRPHGFENLGFYYREYGELIGAACVALVPLPEYAIARLRTGQYISGQGQLWMAEFRPAE